MCVRGARRLLVKCLRIAACREEALFGDGLETLTVTHRDGVPGFNALSFARRLRELAAASGAWGRVARAFFFSLILISLLPESPTPHRPRNGGYGGGPAPPSDGDRNDDESRIIGRRRRAFRKPSGSAGARCGGGGRGGETGRLPGVFENQTRARRRRAVFRTGIRCERNFEKKNINFVDCFLPWSVLYIRCR